MCKIYFLLCLINIQLKKILFLDLDGHIINKQLLNNFTFDELNKIKTFCLEEQSIISFICGLIFDTGCSFREIIGLINDDISLSRYNPYLVIRSNHYYRN